MGSPEPLVTQKIMLEHSWSKRMFERELYGGVGSITVRRRLERIGEYKNQNALSTCMRLSKNKINKH